MPRAWCRPDRLRRLDRELLEAICGAPHRSGELLMSRGDFTVLPSARHWRCTSYPCPADFIAGLMARGCRRSQQEPMLTVVIGRQGLRRSRRRRKGLPNNGRFRWATPKCFNCLHNGRSVAWSREHSSAERRGLRRQAGLPLSPSLHCP